MRGFEAGQRVFIAPNIGCGHCPQCLRGQSNLCRDYDAFGITLDGAFAEYVRVTAPALEQGNVIPLPRDGCCRGGAGRAARVCAPRTRGGALGAGDVVVIMGAGPIGIMHLLLAGSRRRPCLHQRPDPRTPGQGARTGRGSGRERHRGSLVSVVARQTDGGGADVVIVAAPSRPAQEQAVSGRYRRAHQLLRGHAEAAAADPA